MAEELVYSVIEIFTSEEARWHGSPLYDAIVHTVAKENKFARCIVTKGVAGCYEDGEIASHRVLDLSYNMPLKIEIVLPEEEVEPVLAHVDAMVGEGIVVVESVQIRVHRTHRARGERAAQ